MASCDYLIYIGSCFGALCYLTEFASIYTIYNTIHVDNKRSENKNVNQYALQLRSCIIIANGCFLLYYVENGLATPTYSYSLFLSLDCTIFAIRGYFLYRLLGEPMMVENENHIQNPMYNNNPI